MDYYSTFRNLMGHHWQKLYNSTRYRMDEDVFSWREKGLGYDESFLDQLKKRHAEVMLFREVTKSDGSTDLVRNTNCTTRNGSTFLFSGTLKDNSPGARSYQKECPKEK